MTSYAVRIGFFLLIAADAFGNSFLPVYAKELPLPEGVLFAWISTEMAASLPISIFWLMVAVAQLTTSRWERGRNHRTLFVFAVSLTAVGMLLSGLAQDVVTLIMSRGMSGLGYGAVMILTQDHLIRVMGAEARTRASGLYFTLFFASAITGTLTGSLLASDIGYAMTLVVGAGLSAIAVGFMAMSASHIEEAPPEKLQIRALLRNPPFLGLVIFAAIPSRLINGAFVFYLLPLYLFDHNVFQPTAGWVIMLYSLILATTTSFWSGLVDKTNRPVSFMLAGVLMSAMAMAVIPLGWGGLWGAVAAIGLLGWAQAVGMSPQVTVLFNVTAEEMQRFGRTPLLGLFRVAERLGLFIGPMVAAWLIGGYGYQMALTGLAVIMGASALILAVIFAVAPKAVKG